MERTSPQPAVDLSHHLSTLARARQMSPLKGLQKYIGRTDMISLAGGMPDPAYFPFATITVDALAADSLTSSSARTGLFAWFWSLFGAGQKTSKFSVPKYPSRAEDINLATALQYAPATGIKQLQEFIRAFAEQVHQPAYTDWQTLVDTGNTDGITRAIATLCNPGEQILVEEWTYTSMLAAAMPMGVRPAPVTIDGEGLSSVALEQVLAEWDAEARGAKRPHVLYTVPIGQNPTGATMGIERKKAVYEVCVKYDVVIVEDDPYFFLQEGTWRPPAERARMAGLARRIEADPRAFFSDCASGDLGRAKAALRPAISEDEATRFINSLTPSFVRFDYEGRVVRLDSFSKIIAPGSRLGWITASPRLIERFERHGETNTQAPAGLSQALIGQLITAHWGPAHFLTWLQGIQHQYTARRDFFVDTLFTAFDVRPNYDRDLVAAFGEGVRTYVYTAYAKGRARGRTEKRLALFSFVPPSSGMFVWLKFHVRDKGGKSERSLEQQLWIDLAEHGLLIVPGWFFSPSSMTNRKTAMASLDGEDVRFRISFSAGKNEDMKKGVDVLAKVLKTWVTE